MLVGLIGWTGVGRTTLCREAGWERVPLANAWVYVTGSRIYCVSDLKTAEDVKTVSGLGGVVIRVHRQGKHAKDEGELSYMIQIETQFPNLPFVFNDDEPSRAAMEANRIAQQYFGGG